MAITPAPALRRVLRDRGGMTLIEIMVVVIIVGILAMLAIPRFSNYVAALRAKGAAGQVQSDIAYTRMNAVREGRTVSLSVTSTTGYSILVKNTDGSTLRTLRTVSLSQSYPGTTLATTGGSEVAFDSRGILKSGSASKLTLTKDSRVQSLSISLVGRVIRDAAQ